MTLIYRSDKTMEVLATLKGATVVPTRKEIITVNGKYIGTVKEMFHFYKEENETIVDEWIAIHLV